MNWDWKSTYDLAMAAAATTKSRFRVTKNLATGEWNLYPTADRASRKTPAEPRNVHYYPAVDTLADEMYRNWTTQAL